MKIEKVTGIILSDTDYSESSKILNVYTKEHGKIGIISKGCRSLKSSLRSVSTKLTYGDFNIYYKEDGLSTLISVDVINDFISIKKDLGKIGYATYLLDLTNQVLKETDMGLFDIISSALIKINEGFDPMIITNIVELKYLDFLGVMPVLDKCCCCGSKNNIVTLSGDQGGYLCKNCYKDNEYIVDDKTIKLVRMFYYVDINKIKELNILDKNKFEINRFLEIYYTRYTGLYLKSKDFLKQLRN